MIFRIYFCKIISPEKFIALCVPQVLVEPPLEGRLTYHIIRGSMPFFSCTHQTEYEDRMWAVYELFYYFYRNYFLSQKFSSAADNSYDILDRTQNLTDRITNTHPKGHPKGPLEPCSIVGLLAG